MEVGAEVTLYVKVVLPVGAQGTDEEVEAAIMENGLGWYDIVHVIDIDNTETI